MTIEQFKTDEVILSNINQDTIPKQTVVQGEKDGRSLTVHVRNGGVVEPQAGLNLNLGWKHRTAKDKNGELIQGLDAFQAIDRSTGHFRVEYASSMAQPGTIDAEIQFVTSTSVTKSQPFTIIVKPSTVDENAVESESSFTVLQEALSQVSKYDEKIEGLDINKADKKDIEKVEDLVSKLPSATPKETFTNLASLQEKYPNGSTSAMVVLETDGKTGYVYLWDGSAWKKGALYQAQGIDDGAIKTNNIADQAIATEMLPFVRNVSENLFDINSDLIIKGKFINVDSASNGYDKLYDQKNYNVTHPIYIKRNQSVYLVNMFYETSIRYCQMVDANNKFIKYVDISQSAENEKYDKFTAPSSAFYRFNMFSTPIKNFAVTLEKIVETSDRAPILMIENIEMNSDFLSAGAIPLEMVQDVLIDDYFEGSNFHTNLYINQSNDLVSHSSDTVRITKPIYLRNGQYTTTFYPNLGSIGKCARVFPDGKIAKIIDSDGKSSDKNITEFTIDSDGYYIFNHMGGTLNGTTFDKFHIIRGTREDYLNSPMEKKVTIPRLKTGNGGSGEGIDYDIFEQAYIKGGKLISNLDKKPTINNTAFYTFADIKGNCKKIIAKVRYKGRNGAALIATAQGKSKVQDILKKSVHIVFDYNRVNVQVIIDNVRTTFDQITYEQPCDTTGATLYTMGWELIDNTLTVYTPDGKSFNYENDLFQQCNGQFVCWEHYTEKNWENRGDVEYEYFEATSSDDRLKDSFKRGDGAIGISETGHIYTQFSSIETYK